MENCDIIMSIGYLFTELLITVEPACVIFKRSIFIQKINYRNMRKNLILLDKNNCKGDYLCIIQSAVIKTDS